MNKTHRLELKNSPWPSGSWHTLVSESERGREREREREAAPETIQPCNTPKCNGKWHPVFSFIHNFRPWPIARDSTIPT